MKALIAMLTASALLVAGALSASAGPEMDRATGTGAYFNPTGHP